MILAKPVLSKLRKNAQEVLWRDLFDDFIQSFIATEYTILPLHGKIWVTENPYFGIFYAINMTMTHKICAGDIKQNV